MRYLVLLLSLLQTDFTSVKAKAPSHTFVIQVFGDDPELALWLKSRVLKTLAEKPCFRISDVDDRTSASTYSECHRFIEYRRSEDIYGKPGSPGSAILFKVSVGRPVASGHYKVSVQGYYKKKDYFQRYFNPGEFTLPTEDQVLPEDLELRKDRLAKDVSRLILSLSFK